MALVQGAEEQRFRAELVGAIVRAVHVTELFQRLDEAQDRALVKAGALRDLGERQPRIELAARGLKTVTLELGGKSPNIVFDDADMDQAVKGVVSGIFAPSGQTCQAGSRLLVQRSIHDAFVDKLVAFVKTAKLGDPALPGTQIGPITTRPQFERILSFIRTAKEEGARCVLGGNSRPNLRPGVVHRAHDPDQRPQSNAHCPGGGVRPRACGHPVRRRAGGDRDRQ